MGAEQTCCQLRRLGMILKALGSLPDLYRPSSSPTWRYRSASFGSTFLGSCRSVRPAPGLAGSVPGSRCEKNAGN